MSILDQIIEEIGDSDTDTKIKMICDKIFEEEKDKIEHIDDLPIGPNIFIAIEVPPKHKYPTFVCLEREGVETYIISNWERRSMGTVRVGRVIDIKYSDTNRIMREFAKHVKCMRGINYDKRGNIINK